MNVEKKFSYPASAIADKQVQHILIESFIEPEGRYNEFHKYVLAFDSNFVPVGYSPEYEGFLKYKIGVELRLEVEKTFRKLSILICII